MRTQRLGIKTRAMGSVAVAAFVISMAGCLQPTPLPIIAAVPAFQLISQTGEPFDSRSLDGHIWVADFIYTTCDGPCPMMSAQFRRLQDLTAEMPDVKLVSFTVDPARDTPPVLSAYAGHFKYNPSRWYFLTGEQPVLNEICLKGFMLNSVDGSMTHSTRAVLVDRKQRIRGYYLTNEDGFLRKLVHDIRQLEREHS